ncbi:sugar ABC transporter ATP-binding protein, partial [Streptomyces europaeiscabiei]
RQVADGGKAALIVSDELDDLKVCDRLVVMFHGRVVAEFDRGWQDEHVVAAMEGVAGRADPSAEGVAGRPEASDIASCEASPAITSDTTEEHGR